MPKTSVSASAEDAWSPAIQVIGYFNLSISGTFVATVTAQRSEDGQTWRNVKTWSEPAEDVGLDPILTYYRVGVAVGDYTSGTVDASINGYDVWSHAI